LDEVLRGVFCQVENLEKRKRPNRRCDSALCCTIGKGFAKAAEC